MTIITKIIIVMEETKEIIKMMVVPMMRGMSSMNATILIATSGYSDNGVA